ncbi:MAG TPA: PKD domain-containing protein [Dissulfurispiraceae bacterium]|nr:PKD domain-containing protein [Dissulfurispiraceae bacterium]
MNYKTVCNSSGWTEGQSCSRSFDTFGIHYVQFYAEDSNFAFGLVTIAVHVREPLAVSLSCDSQAEVGKDAICTATVAAGTGPYDYSFDWGDGGKTSFSGVDSVSQAAGHIYNKAGTYPVSVTVNDDAGQSATGTASVSVTLTGCAADEKVCGGECWPNFWTCCGTSACPPGYPCCGNGCCAPGGWCVREGFCCKDGYLPCPDGKSCCTSVDRCNPSGGCF